MSDYGSPGPQGSYGQSPLGSPTPSAPATAASSGDSDQMVMITSYVAGGLGVLTFIWGFLSWFKDGSVGIGGYSVEGAGASAVVGLSLAAGLIAAAAAFEKKGATAGPVALALAAFLVSLGILIGKGSIGPNSSVGTGIGLILALITTIVQTAGLAYGWLLASGRMSAPAKSAPSQQWGSPQGYGGFPQSGGPQGGSYPPPGGQYGQGQPSAPSYSAPGQYGPPPGAPQPPSQPPSPGSSPSNNPYGPPPGGGYSPPSPPGPPPSAPSGPAQSGSTSSMPSQGGYQPPSPSGSDESGSGYGEATRHIPRYNPPGSDSQGS